MTVVLINGASKGMGRAIADHLYQSKYQLSLLSRTIDDTYHDKNVLVTRCDSTNRSDVKSAVQKTVEYFGSVDILINVAGLLHTKEIIDEDEEDLDRIYKTNVKGYWYFVKEVLPQMRDQKNGYIISISSMSGKRGFKTKSSYAMSKFAIQALNEVIIRENREYNIRATAICPGFVDTTMIENLKKPGEKIISTLDIAKTIEYLLNLSEAVLIQEICLERELW